MIISQYACISFFRCSIILLFLHSHSFYGISPTITSSPSTKISILLDPKLDHGIFILRHPNREYLILMGKFIFFITSLLSLTFWMMT